MHVPPARRARDLIPQLKPCARHLPPKRMRSPDRQDQGATTSRCDATSPWARSLRLCRQIERALRNIPATLPGLTSSPIAALQWQGLNAPADFGERMAGELPSPGLPFVSASQ